MDWVAPTLAPEGSCSDAVSFRSVVTCSGGIRKLNVLPRFESVDAALTSRLTVWDFTLGSVDVSSSLAVSLRLVKPVTGATNTRTSAGRPATTGAFFCVTSWPFFIRPIFTAW
ncbi:MAG: hypothetical protein DYH12_13385 [Sorangiineae bacterium PRO1]|nr:hypothetical protein [Sorangiineae bacterium PRO1]